MGSRAALPAKAAAGIVPKPNAGFVVDDAGVLKKETLAELKQLGEDTDYNTGTMMVLITVDYTGTYAVDEYADQVFEDWEIEDGLVLVLAIGDEDYYAMPSAGLSDYLKASDIQDILDEKLEPDFAAADYDAGAKKVYTAFCEKIEALYEQYGIKPEQEIPETGARKDSETAGQTPVSQPHTSAQPRPESGKKSGGSSFLLILFPFIGIILLISLFSRGGRRRRGRGSDMRTYRRTGGYYAPPPPPPPRRRSGFFGPGPGFGAPPPPPPPPPAGAGRDSRRADRTESGGFFGSSGSSGFGSSGGSSSSAGRSSGAGRSSSSGRSSGAGRSFSGSSSSSGRSSSGSRPSAGRGGGFGGGGSRGGGAGRRSGGSSSGGGRSGGGRK